MSDFSPDDAAYLTADKHKKKHNSNSHSEGGERKRSSSKKQPKGILKNSNPNASYHEEGSLKSNSGRNKRVEELMEYERPKTSSHGHGHSHKKHRRDSLKDDSESSGGSSPRTSSSDSRHHSSSSKKHSHSKRNGDHHHECNGSSSRSSSSSKEHKEQKSLERKSHKHHSEAGEKSSKKRNSDHHESRHRQTSDSDTLESTKSNTSGGKQHRERKSSKHRHSEHSEENSSHSNKDTSSSKHHKHQHSSNGGTFTKEEGRKIVREGQFNMDEEVDLTTSFKGKHHKNERHHRQNGDSLAKESVSKESVDLDNFEDIYDRPKVPPVRYIPPGEMQNKKEKKYKESKDDFSYNDINSAIISKSSSIDDGLDDTNDSDDGPLYKTVVKTSKKNGGVSKAIENTNKKPSRNNFDSNEEEFIDSLQAIDVMPKPANGGFYENVGFGSAKMDCKDDGFTPSKYVEEDMDGDDKFITVGEALSKSSNTNNSNSKYVGNASKDNKNEFDPHSNKNISITKKGGTETVQPLYDVPRSNPRRVSPTSLLQSASETLANAIPSDFAAEAVYVNDSYTNELVSSMMNSVNEDQLGFDQYDIPRSNKNLSDLIPQEYDVPKNRDSLSTIEEEHQEYDIPKPLLDSYLMEKKYDTGTKKTDDAHDNGNIADNHMLSTLQKIGEQNEPAINDPFDTNLYENQNEIFQNSSNENIYANDGVIVDSVGGGNTNLCNSHR